MSFINEIYSELANEYPEGEKQVNYMSAFYTLINYLELIDNSVGLSETDLKNRFFGKLEYKTIVEKFITHGVLEKSTKGNFVLNGTAKKVIEPIFDNLMTLPMKKSSNIPKNDPSLNLLYNYKSKLFISE